MKVNCPNVKGKIKLKTYGTLEIGDVPNPAFVTRDIPSALKNSPVTKIEYLFTSSEFDIPPPFFLPENISDADNETGVLSVKGE